ncbi:type IV pilus assembly protein PilM [Patescibacteria group bacterium]|nr:type IV pilus assembly protein PilM [Patescibacteria group bacterium]
MFNILKKQATSSLGIDIGTTGIRVVQLGLKDKKISLENYASIETKDYLEILGSDSKFNNIRMSDKKISGDLAKIISDAGISSKKVSMAVPISSAFSSIISLPDMPEEEIENAINFEARQYIPISIDEVIFDWVVVGKTDGTKNSDIVGDKNIKKLKVLLVAIPKEITNKYVSIVDSLGLELVALETESFSLAMAFSRDEKGTTSIVDIGNKTTSITIVENGEVISGHSISGTGGEEITKIISHGVDVDFHRAEQLKMDIGFNKDNASQKQVSEIVLPIMSIIISEIKKINENYTKSNKKSVNKIIITGRTSYISGLAEYFTKEIGIPTEIGNPWKKISYDKALNKKLQESSPYFSVAVGLALRGLEDGK